MIIWSLNTGLIILVHNSQASFVLTRLSLLTQKTLPTFFGGVEISLHKGMNTFVLLFKKYSQNASKGPRT